MKEKETVNPIKTNNSKFDDFFNGDVHLHEMLKAPEKTEIGELLKYAFEYGYEKGFSDGFETGKQNGRKLQLGKSNLLRDVERLKKRNEQLKKNAIVWNKVTCFNEPDENGYITATNPAEEGKDYLVLLKNKRILISALAYDDDGYFFEDFDWEDIEAWAELPEVEK